MNARPRSRSIERARLALRRRGVFGTARDHVELDLPDDDANEPSEVRIRILRIVLSRVCDDMGWF
jgi:hypothetical protein